MAEDTRKRMKVNRLILTLGIISLLFLSGCAGSLGSNGYELDTVACHATGGEVLINHNSETMRCIY